VSAAPLSQRPIALVGLRCVGKTSVGRVLAQQLGVKFVDLDEVLAAEGARAHAAASVGDLLRAVGIDEFRRLEGAALRSSLSKPGRRVIATGGGVVERDENRELLAARAICVWLRNDVALLQRRLAADPASRPALLGRDPVLELAELARRREPLYRAVAAHAIDCGAATPTEIAARIVAQLPRQP
jgi:shikimate kinase